MCISNFKDKKRMKKIENYNKNNNNKIKNDNSFYASLLFFNQYVCNILFLSNL
jgi:hypothetical protein